MYIGIVASLPYVGARIYINRGNMGPQSHLSFGPKEVVNNDL